MNALPEVVDIRIVKWKVEYVGIRGGIIVLYIIKNRVSFIKRFILKDDESFKTAIKICENKVTRILHIKNRICTDLARIANYCIDSYSVEKMTPDEEIWI